MFRFLCYQRDSLLSISHLLAFVKNFFNFFQKVFSFFFDLVASNFDSLSQFLTFVKNFFTIFKYFIKKHLIK